MIDAASGLTGCSPRSAGGDVAAVNQLHPGRLRRFAKRHMAGQRRGHTLQTRDLRDLGRHTQLSMPTQSPRPGRDWHGELRMVSQNLPESPRYGSW